MNWLSLSYCIAVFATAFFSADIAAYPEYAVRYNMISCTSCHVSPVGGGPRNINGKLFGAHGFKINPKLVQDYVSADFRALYYHPQQPLPSKGGMGIMSGSVAGHIPLDSEEKYLLVIEHNVAGFASAQLRDTYALFRPSGPIGNHNLDSILIGRFRSPFGIVTDEHRTYTRVQSATEWYTFESGVLFSGSPSDKWHYDWALLSGENSTGQSLKTGDAKKWGSVVNWRWMPGHVLFGTSAAYHDHDPNRDSRHAFSFYSMISLGRSTFDRIPLTVQVEHVIARGWESNLGRGFANDSSYVASLSNAHSRGWLARVDWAIHQRFDLIYKYDYLQPDKDYPADIYDRHGVGFRWVVGPNTLLQARTEFAHATHPTENNSTNIGGQNASFVILQMGL